jgi:cytosine/adenosine deaminase-related metal-dependent hydrolase
LLGPRTLLVHAQHVQEAEIVRLARSRTPVVICPGTVAWFRRPRPPLTRLLASGICVGLGTDSIASNDDLSIRAEMGRVRSLWPGLPPESVLYMATTAGGRCLARPGLGRLAVGGAADFIVVPMGVEAGEFLDAFTAGRSAPESTWLKGHRYSRIASLEAAGSRS